MKSLTDIDHLKSQQEWRRLVVLDEEGARKAKMATSRRDCHWECAWLRAYRILYP